MPPNDGDAAYLWDTLQAAREVSAFVAGRLWRDFESDMMLRRAIEREIEIIGEAARKVSPEFREAHPEIPWASIIAQRNVLAHEYGEIKLDRIWMVATVRVPQLVGLLEPLIPPLPPEV
jgi:uncharacterized protein with HEPN domain